MRLAERQVQVARVNGVAFGEDHGALDAVLQLADVSRPQVRMQLRHGGVRQHQRLLVQIAAEPIDEVLRQHRDIGAALAQRRNRDRENGQPEVQVFPVLARRDGRLQIAIRRRDDPDVHLQRHGAADALESLLFERAENLGLQRKRQIADFIEEQRAAVRHLELARLAVRGARERAFLVAEELGFEQRFRDRRAVDGHERPVGARAEHVQRPREQFLARPAFAFEEHGGVGRRRALKGHDHVLQLGVLADDLRRAAPRGELVLQKNVLVGQPALHERTLDHQQQVIRIHRLGEEVERALLHRRDRVLDAAERRHHDDRQLRIELLRRLAARRSRRLRAAADPTARRPAASSRSACTASVWSRASTTV